MNNCNLSSIQLHVEEFRGEVLPLDSEQSGLLEVLMDTSVPISYLDLVVISSRHEERLGTVKVHSSHRSIVLIEAIDQRAHAIIP